MSGTQPEGIAEKVARTRHEQGLPAAIPASSLRALAEHVKAARESQDRKQGTAA